MPTDSERTAHREAWAAGWYSEPSRMVADMSDRVIPLADARGGDDRRNDRRVPPGELDW